MAEKIAGGLKECGCSNANIQAVVVFPIIFSPTNCISKDVNMSKLDVVIFLTCSCTTRIKRKKSTLKLNFLHLEIGFQAPRNLIIRIFKGSFGLDQSKFRIPNHHFLMHWPKQNWQSFYSH